MESAEDVVEQILDGRGMFCENFSSPRGHWKPCLGVWCEKCYKSPRDEKYRIVLSQEEGGFDLTSEEDKLRREVARIENCLMISF